MEAEEQPVAVAELQDTPTPHHESIDSVFNNTLIVGNICFFTASVPELLNFRLISRPFHYEATKRLRDSRHKLIDLTNEKSLNEFLTRMQGRLNLGEANCFPYTGFKLDLQNKMEGLVRFASEVGQHVRRLKFVELPDHDEEEIQLEQKVVMLLQHTPNLVEIELITTTPVHVSNADLVTFPNTFPRLQVISLDHRDSTPHTQPNCVPLLTVLINRAVNLKLVGFMRIEERQGLMALRALAQHPNRDFISIERSDLTVRSVTLPVMQEISNFNLRFRSLDTNLVLLSRSIETIENAVTRFTTWLSRLTTSLHTLNLNIYVGNFDTVTFPIPTLTQLTEFQFFMMPTAAYNAETTVIIPLIPNQFPALKKLSLIFVWCGDGVVVFDDNPQPSVQELEINCHSSLLPSSPWHRILPNLNSITLQAASQSEYGVPNLIYILRHFPHLTRLEINFKPYSPHRQLGFWNILTGGATGPITGQALLNGLIHPDQELEESVDGVYPVPSLGNLHALRTLICRPGTRSTLDAIVYMTRVGRLGPLNNLTLTGLQFDLDMQVDERKVYYDVLAQVHTEVTMDGAIRYESFMKSGIPPILHSSDVFDVAD